jgi:hypothetical protein
MKAEDFALFLRWCCLGVVCALTSIVLDPAASPWWLLLCLLAPLRGGIDTLQQIHDRRAHATDAGGGA